LAKTTSLADLGRHAPRLLIPPLHWFVLKQEFRIRADLLRSGDPRALARAISAVENHAPGWIDLLKDLFPHTGHAFTLGITGSPGAGKSTLVDQLARHYRKENKQIGIIAVDPT